MSVALKAVMKKCSYGRRQRNTLFRKHSLLISSEDQPENEVPWADETAWEDTVPEMLQDLSEASKEWMEVLGLSVDEATEEECRCCCPRTDRL